MCLRRLGSPASTSSGLSSSMLRRKRLAGSDDVAPRVGLQRADRGDDDRDIRAQPADPALDVEEALGAHVGAEARLGDDVVAAAHGR